MAGRASARLPPPSDFLPQNRRGLLRRFPSELNLPRTPAGRGPAKIIANLYANVAFPPEEAPFPTTAAGVSVAGRAKLDTRPESVSIIESHRVPGVSGRRTKRE